MIKVTNDFYIGADTYGYTLYKKMIKKETKQEYFDAYSYHVSIEGCIQSIKRSLKRQKCSEDLSLHDYLEECKKINAEMKAILNGIKEVET